MTAKRKCFIGIVAFQGVNYKIAENYFAWAFHLGRRVPEFDFLLRVIGKKEQFRARNNIVDMAKNWLTGPDDILLMLDDDMILPQNTFERLVKVLDDRPDAGLVGGLYWQRGGSYRPVIQKIFHKFDGVGMEWYAPHEITGGVMQVGVVGGGCLMFPMRTIRELMPPVFWVDGIVGTDIHVCIRINQAGFNVYCDTGLELGHLMEGTILTQKDLPPRMVKYSHYSQQLEEAACEYLKMSLPEMETFQLNSLWTMEENWAKKPRETFDQIADAYLEIGDIAVARNVYYGIHSSTGIEGFSDLVDSIDKGIIKRDYPCLDYGCGVGVATEILAQAGYQVEAMDLAGSAVLKFLDWRVSRNGIRDNVKISPVTDDKPVFQDKYSFVVMLDVIEHLMNPHEICEDILARIVPGGHLHTNFTVMDFKGADQGVHQHLKRITLAEFEELLTKHRMIPVGTFLYQKAKEAING